MKKLFLLSIICITCSSCFDNAMVKFVGSGKLQEVDQQSIKYEVGDTVLVTKGSTTMTWEFANDQTHDIGFHKAYNQDSTKLYVWENRKAVIVKKW